MMKTKDFYSFHIVGKCDRHILVSRKTYKPVELKELQTMTTKKPAENLPLMQNRQAQKAYLRSMKDRITALKDV